MITVLFTDLVGSTELLSKLGDDGAEEIRRTHFAALRRAVADAGGREVKTLGDGIMAAFTSPRAAVSAALAIQEDAQRVAAAGKPVSVRIGLHAGEPFFEGDDLHGMSVVLARRLCDAAAGGQILASELVAGLVGNRLGCSFHSLGDLSLKGLPDPVAAVEVIGEAPPGGSTPAAPTTGNVVTVPVPRGPALVGRDEECRLVVDELGRATAGEFRCLLVLGDPGVGKSRLTGEVLSRRTTDVRTIAGRAYWMGTTAPLALWINALDRSLRSLPATAVRDLAGPYLLDLASVLATVQEAAGGRFNPETPRHRLLEGFTVLLERAARGGPVAVLLDDVHLADASSWEAVEYVARSLTLSPVLLVLVARPAELAENPVGTRICFGLEQDGLLRRVTLRPLDSSNVRLLVAAELARSGSPVASTDVPGRLVAWLSERSAGNPLFVLGLLRALLEEGADLAAPRLRALPEDLAERVRSRLTALDPDARAAAEAMAALGRPVGLRELGRILGRDVETLDPGIDQLRRARMVTAEDSGREPSYEFAHPLFGQAVYEGIGAARRLSLHRGIARSLVAAGGHEEAAPHYARSAEVGDAEAIDALRDAVRQAESRGAHREAVTLLNSLVELLPPADPRWVEVADALSWQSESAAEQLRGDVRVVLGDRALREMDAVLAGSGDPARRAEVKLRLASSLSWMRGEVEEAEQLCRTALGLFEEAGDRRRRLLAEIELAWILGMAGDFKGLTANSLRLARAAEAMRDAFLELQALWGVGTGAAFSGEFEVAQEAIERTIALAQASNNPLRRAWGLAHGAWTFALAGDVNEAAARFEAARSNPGHENLPISAWTAAVHWTAGDFTRALEVTEELLAGSSAALTWRSSFGLAYGSLAACALGRHGYGRVLAERGLAMIGERERFFYRLALEHGLAISALEERDDALDELRRVAERLLAIGALPHAAFALADLAEAASHRSDLELIRFAADALQTVADRIDLDCYQGLAATAAALGMLTAGRSASAAARAAEAVTLLQATGWKGFLGRGEAVLARAHEAE